MKISYKLCILHTICFIILTLFVLYLYDRNVNYNIRKPTMRHQQIYNMLLKKYEKHEQEYYDLLKQKALLEYNQIFYIEQVAYQDLKMKRKGDTFIIIER